MWRDQVKIAETVVQDDDERVEAWYLLAHALFRLKKYATAEECCVNVRNLIIKFKIVNPMLEAGTREIYEEIQVHKAKLAKKAEETKQAAGGGEEDEWATESEEDVDNDDDDDE